MKRSLTFKHVSGILYYILERDMVMLCVRAYGFDVFVVDKHQTAIVAKKTTNIDKFERTVWESNEGEMFWWNEIDSKACTRADNAVCDVLDEIVVHYTSYIAKLTVE